MLSRDRSTCPTYHASLPRSASAARNPAAAQTLRLYGGTIGRILASVSGCAIRHPARRAASPCPLAKVRPTITLRRVDIKGGGGSPPKTREGPSLENNVSGGG